MTPAAASLNSSCGVDSGPVAPPLRLLRRPRVTRPPGPEGRSSEPRTPGLRAGSAAAADEGSAPGTGGPKKAVLRNADNGGGDGTGHRTQNPKR